MAFECTAMQWIVSTCDQDGHINDRLSVLFQKGGVLNFKEIEERVGRVYSATDWHDLRYRTRALAYEIGAELPKRRLRQLEAFRACAERHILEGSSEQWPHFISGLLFGISQLCDGYIAQLTPPLEHEAESLRKTQSEIVLALFAAEGPLSPSKLALATTRRRDAISRALKSLRQEGYVEEVAVQGASSDNRQRPHKLTALGENAARKLQAVPAPQADNVASAEVEDSPPVVNTDKHVQRYASPSPASAREARRASPARRRAELLPKKCRQLVGAEG